MTTSFSFVTKKNQILPSGIPTYGALILPFDKDEIFNKNKVKNNPKSVQDFKGKLRSALNLNNNQNLLLGAIKHPTQTFSVLSSYMKDERTQMNGLTILIGSKFSGIAVAQALINGKVTSKEALDYLFMGFAPALGVTGSLLGYSGLNQIKDALAQGTIDVGAFISGFTRTLKGVIDLKDMLARKNQSLPNEVLLLDLTLSHSEQYQSETPDRRVQNGQSLNEYIHNLPETIDIQCALQEDKRYSKAEFRAIIQEIRKRKDLVTLILGNETFDNLMITNFVPNHDCTKSGMDYTMSFKRIVRNDIDTKTEVTIQKMPQPYLEQTTKGGLNQQIGAFGQIPDVTIPQYTSANQPVINFDLSRWVNGESILEIIGSPESRDVFYKEMGKEAPTSIYQKIFGMGY